MSTTSLNIPLYVYNKIFAFRAIWSLTNSHENKAVHIMLKNQTMSIKFISAKFLIYACSHLALSFGTVTFLSSHSPSILSTYHFSCTWMLSFTSVFLLLPMFFFLFFSFFHFFWYRAEVKGNSCLQKHVQASSSKVISESLLSKP